MVDTPLNIEDIIVMGCWLRKETDTIAATTSFFRASIVAGAIDDT